MLFCINQKNQLNLLQNLLPELEILHSINPKKRIYHEHKETSIKIETGL